MGAVWASDFGGNKTFSGGAIDYTTDSDRIASFSQRHATLLDVFAPGIFITGANATGSTQSMGGTSQAAPFISGIAVLAQQIAQEKLGRRLTLSEFRSLIDNTSIIINDGDNENDNVNNTGLNFPRVNMLALAEGILNLNSQGINPGNSNPNNNSSDEPLYLPGGSVKLTHTVTLTSGQIASNLDFGNQRLNNAPTLENAIADQTATEGQPFNFTFPANTFNDIDAGDTLTYSARLENGNTLPSWLTFNTTTRSFSGTPTDTASGTYNLTITATDTAGATVADTFTLNVINVVNGTSNSETINGTSSNDNINAGDGNDTVNGGDGDDIIDGGTGSDRLIGGRGNDTYILDNRRDVVVEVAGEGIDTIQSNDNHTLGANLENLTLTGTGNTSGTGNELDNYIQGNSGNNQLKGLAGNDTLVGGAGNDILVGGSGDDLLEGGAGADRFLFGSGSAFNTNAFGVDTISDFTKGTDVIALSKNSFTALRSAINTSLLPSDFATINELAANEVTVAGMSSASIIYNQTTGNLLYNQNLASSGLGQGGVFANIPIASQINLDANNFFVQA